MKAEVKEGFKKVYGSCENTNVYFAPGRVNLIGEHTDYNGGYVFPCAINLGTYGVVRKRTDGIIKLFSENFSEAGIIEFSLAELRNFQPGNWENYVKGVFLAFLDKGYLIDKGMEIYIYGNLPAGSGLSSSASLEVLIATILDDEYELNVSKKDKALLSQIAENKYNGCNCGIMDQFASAFGEKDSAIFLNTGTLDYKIIPLELMDASIVITNTKVKHNLASSDYNQRRLECEKALEILQTVIDVNSLCEIEPDTFNRYENLIKDETIRKRAKHAIYENYRTQAGVKALMNGDIYKFGKLMKESHISLRDDYEVSCRELDILAETAFEMPGVIGSRMTGGGFGGCTVSIVKNMDIDFFEREIFEIYNKTTGLEAEFYVVMPGIRAGRI